VSQSVAGSFHRDHTRSGAAHHHQPPISSPIGGLLWGPQSPPFCFFPPCGPLIWCPTSRIGFSQTKHLDLMASP